MIETVFIRVIAVVVLSLFIIGETNGESVYSNSTDIRIENSTSLESLIEKKLNCINNTECHLKSRRKRYVAFPEGSSFSVCTYLCL